MELRQMRYFLSAARHLSFTEAARECYIVQSAMSQQMRALEKELGATLFERTKQGLRLTPEGRALQRETLRVLGQIEAMQSAVRQASTDAVNTLRVGVQGSLMRVALPRAIAKLREERPGVRVFVRTGAHQKLMGEMKGEQIDAILTINDIDPDAADGLCVRAVSDEIPCALLPKESPLARQTVLTVQDLLGETLYLSVDAVAGLGGLPAGGE